MFDENSAGATKRLLLPSVLLALGLALSSCSAEADAEAGKGQAKDQSSAPAASEAASTPVTPAASTAPAASSPTTEAPAVPQVGVPFLVDMGSGDVARITIVAASYSETASTQSFAPAATKGGFLVLDVLWETEAGVTSSNPLYFNAKDSDGRKGDGYMFADDQLGAGEVQVGDKSRGIVAFDIAPGPSTVVITDPLLQEAARIEIG